MNLGLKIFCCCLLLIARHPLASQYQITTINQEVLPEVDKLHFLSQMDDGTYWMTSEKGITRFDGDQGKLYTISDPELSVQQNQYLQSPVFQAPDGRFWVATYSAIHVFDPERESFKTIQFEDFGDHISENYRILSVDDSTGQLFMQAGNYLWNYNPEDNEYEKVAGPTNGVSFVSMGPNRWASVGYNKTLEIFERNSQESAFELKTYSLPHSLSAIANDGEDGLWLGTNNGLSYFEPSNDGKNFTYTVVFAKAPCEALLRHSDETIWFAELGVGLHHYTPSTNSLSTYTPSQGLSGNNPRYLTEDAMGNILAAHYDVGVDFLSPGSSNFLLYSVFEERKITQVHSPDNQKLLVSDEEGGIFQLKVNKQGGITTRKMPSQANQKFQTPGTRFTAMGGHLWAGNQRYIGEYLPDSEDFKWRSRPEEKMNHFYWSKDSLLIILTKRGIKSSQTTRDEFTPLLPFPATEDVRFTGLFGLTDSSFLVWDRGVEVWPCSVRDKKVTINARIPLKGRMYSALSWKGHQFLGTNDGLFEIIGDTVIQVLKVNILGDPLNIRGMLADRNGKKIWISTLQGVVCFDPENGNHFLYNKAAGFNASPRAADPVQLNDGSIWLPAYEGIVTFHPDSIRYSTPQLSPIINGFWLNEIKQPLAGAGKQLTEVTSTYTKNSLIFKLGLVGFLPAGECSVEYQLKDYDLVPNRVARNGLIRYPRLPPGNYELSLTAIDGVGNRSNSAIISVAISPPIWATIWFRLTLFFALLLVLALVYAFLLRMERRKEKRRQEKEAMLTLERERIAGEVHDDLGGQLSSIMFLSEELLVTEAAPKMVKELGRINELSRHSLHNIRDIIFALDNRRATVTDLGEQLQAAGMEFFQDYRIAFTFKGNVKRKNHPVGSRQKRNLFSIVREAWNNIAKHAKASTVVVGFAEQADELVVTISDDGVGLKNDDDFKATTGGYGLENIHARARAINGKLKIESQPGRGTTIILYMPLNTFS